MEQTQQSNQEKYAVLLIDMQTHFLRNMPKPHLDSLVGAQKDVLRCCEINDVPVAVLEFQEERYGKTLPDLKYQASRVPRNITIPKEKDCGFRGAPNHDLAQIIRGWEAGTVCLMGINASYCVLDTGKGANINGFGVVTAPQIIGDAMMITPGTLLRNTSEDKALAELSKIGTIYPNYSEIIRKMGSRSPQ